MWKQHGKLLEIVLNSQRQIALDIWKRGNTRNWFDENCTNAVEKRKQAKVNWLPELNDIHLENLGNIRRETSRRKYLKEKINDIEVNRKHNNIRDMYQGIRVHNKGFQIY